MIIGYATKPDGSWRMVDISRMALGPDETFKLNKPAISMIHVRAEKIAAIRREAVDRIGQIVPEHKQRNLLAKAVYLVDRISRGLTVSAEEQAEMSDMRDAWVTINEIRKASEAAEARIMAATTPTEAEAVTW